MTELLMPALSPTMEEATLARWLVAVGDTVMPGDVVAEVETDKATMEVEAAEEGVVEMLIVAEGAEGVKINSPIARLRPRQEDAAAPVAPTQPLSPAVRRIVADEGLNPAAIVGSGRGGRLTKGDVLTAAAERRESNSSEDRPASALARRMAQAAGLALTRIHGSGSSGRILKADVDTALGRSRTEPTPPPASQPPTDPDARRIVPLDGMRKTIARRMAESFRDIPHFPLTVDVQLDKLLELRAGLNAALPADGGKISLNDLIIRAAALSLRDVPEANASYTPDGIVLHRHADIAVAVAIDGGLVTPIVRAAETKSVVAIAAEMKDLSARARNRRLRPEEFEGGSFSISNLGMFGVKTFSSILNAPQAAILSVGAAEVRPIVREGAIAAGSVASITLTCDHRALDGAGGARFLSALSHLIANPLRLLS